MMSGTAVPTLTEDRLLMTWLGEGELAVGLAWAVGRVEGAWDFLGEREGVAPPNPPSEWPQDQAPYLEDSF